MKTFVVLFGIVAVALAEKEAPYPPSGWKPDGPQLTYPPPTPSNEYGPATTAAPTTQPPPPQEPPSTYIPSEENSQQGSNGYQRYQNQRVQSQASAQFNQGTGQFFIITPQGQLQHIPINVPQSTNTDAELVETQQDQRKSSRDRLVQQSSTRGSEQKSNTNETRQRTQPQQPQQENSNLVSITPDGRLERVQGTQRQQSGRLSADANQGQTQFVAFLPAVPLNRLQTAAAVQQSPQNGQYHVIYPNGRLQRVQYMNVLTPDNRLTANVQYQEVDPIRGPLYTFGSPLVRVL